MHLSLFSSIAINCDRFPALLSLVLLLLLLLLAGIPTISLLAQSRVRTFIDKNNIVIRNSINSTMKLIRFIVQVTKHKVVLFSCLRIEPLISYNIFEDVSCTSTEQSQDRGSVTLMRPFSRDNYPENFVKTLQFPQFLSFTV